MKTPTFLFLTICLLSILTTYSTCNIPLEAEDDVAKFEKQIIVNNKTFSLTERMTHYNIPGVSIAFIKGGKITWAKGYGIRDTSQNNTPPKYVTTTTRFQAASISKVLTGMGVMKLVQQQKLDLDKDVNDYLTNWEVSEMKSFSMDAEKITLRQLLSHTAGMNVHGFSGYHRSDELPSMIDILDKGSLSNSDSVRVFYEPGSKYEYSGGGYTIVEKIIEDVTKMPFERFMHQEIITPLAMAWSSYKQPLAKKWHKSASSGFDTNGVVYNGKWRVYPEQAAAGMWSTPSDIARFLIGVHNVVAEKSQGFLRIGILRIALTQADASVYGMGPVIEGSKFNITMSHAGSNGGFKSQFRFNPYSGDGYVIMTNGDNGFVYNSPNEKGIVPEIENALTKVFGLTWP